MVFSSLQFIFVFLPLFLTIYFILPQQWRNFAILTGSIIFYAAGTWDKPQYTALLVLSAAVNFLAGKAVEKGVKKGRGRGILVLGIIYNLAWLCVFKYADFILKTSTLWRLLGEPKGS